jgi:hypothetical protein
MLTREKAFLVIMSICLFQLSSSESCSKRCLCSVTVLMIVLFIIRDTKTQILMNKPENVQVEAARIVTGGTRLVSLRNLYIMFIPITIVRKL